MQVNLQHPCDPIDVQSAPGFAVPNGQEVPLLDADALAVYYDRIRLRLPTALRESFAAE